VASGGWRRPRRARRSGSDHDAHEFRNRIIESRDAIRHGAKPAEPHGASQTELMQAMLSRLDEIAALLRERS
jgi:hypothetical protein